MKKYIALFTVLALFGTGLYLSDRYERVIFAEEIAAAQREKTKEKIIDKTEEVAKAKTISMNSGILDLYGLGLIGLKDDAFVDYTFLQKVNFSQNRFTTIPRALKDLVNLESLDLSNNKITDIAPDDAIFSDLQNIKNYNLSGNKITVFDFLPKFEHKPKPKNTFASNVPPVPATLNLSDNLITKVDFSEIKYRSNINVLHLSNNRLTTFYADLLFLNELSELDLSFNRISKIDSLAFLKDGSSLLETKNQLKKSSLTKLFLYQNALTAFPALLGKIAPNLEILGLQGNKISGPILIDGFNQLKNLVITSQKVSSFTIAKYSGKNLQEIDLRDNQIKEVDGLSHLRHLESLDLSDNQLTAFPYDVLFSDSLKKLTLAKNQLKGAVAIGSNNHLSILDLAYNRLASLDFVEAKALKKIDLYQNDLRKVTFNKTAGFYQDLERIDFADNPNFKNLSLEALMKAAPNLKIIYLEGTGIAKNPELKLKFQTLARQKGVKLIFSK